MKFEWWRSLKSCHSRDGGNPGSAKRPTLRNNKYLDSRLRGNDGTSISSRSLDPKSLPKFASLLLALLLPLAAAAAPLFDSPATTKQIEALVPPTARALTRQAVLTGGFTQKKTLSDLPKPLLSSGDFLFAKDRGVIWHVRKPFDSEFVLTPKAVITREAGSERVTSASEQPGLAVAAKLFSALFALDLAALEQEFSLYAAGNAQDWSVGLKPRHAAMAATFAQAVITGGAEAKTITLMDARGDSTEIVLGKLHGQAALTDTDARRFPQ